MRPVFLLAPFLMFAAPALAEPLMLAKGNWPTTSDIYFSGLVKGQALDVPSEHTTLEECWMTDEEVRIDEGLASFF